MLARPGKRDIALLTLCCDVEPNAFGGKMVARAVPCRSAGACCAGGLVVQTARYSVTIKATPVLPRHLCFDGISARFPYSAMSPISVTPW
jgi:hypothetical protein